MDEGRPSALDHPVGVETSTGADAMSLRAAQSVAVVRLRWRIGAEKGDGPGVGPGDRPLKGRRSSERLDADISIVRPDGAAAAAVEFGVIAEELSRHPGRGGENGAERRQVGLG